MSSTADTFPADDTSHVPALPEHVPLACPLCGQLHTRIKLRPGDTSKCVRCDSQLARGRASNWIVTFAWVLTGLILWVPANLLPIVNVSQLGNAHRSQLITGAISLWDQGMPWVSVLVVLCGIVAPLLLLLTFGAVLVPIVFGRPSARVRFMISWLRSFELWSIPEVYLLAVLVAFIKLSSLARAEPAAGLWCYAVMSFALLIAWRRFDIDEAAQALTTEKIKGPVT
ncbi:paraquat-inducible protein A [Oleiharenicola lentus]|uniref:paraquat-inducible protein A n=1 Tax=Oleiharenicola lentus TaxID=2508720 RepID=UPI003F6773A5